MASERTVQAREHSGMLIASSIPIRYLMEVDLIGLLPLMYERILIPESARIELTRSAERGRVVPDLAYPWLEVVEPERSPVFNAHPLMTRGDLDVFRIASGEKGLLLLEPKSLRQVAQINKYNATGTLGLIVIAKKIGLVDKVKPLLPLLQKAGLTVSRNLRSFVLQQSGELDADEAF